MTAAVVSVSNIPVLARHFLQFSVVAVFRSGFLVSAGHDDATSNTRLAGSRLALTPVSASFSAKLFLRGGPAPAAAEKELRGGFWYRSRDVSLVRPSDWLVRPSDWDFESRRNPCYAARPLACRTCYSSASFRSWFD